jgi:DNA-binding transcriptional regulator YdaS (Cro superfamily)
MKLKTFLAGMTRDQRQDFAKRCGFSIGQLNNLMYGCKPCRAEYAINIERESGGKVRVEELVPSVDWRVIRGKPKAISSDKRALA